MDSRFTQRFLLLPAFLLFCSFASSLAVHAQGASRPDVSEEALAAIEAAIGEVQAEIASRTSERAGVYKALQEIETSLTALGRQIADLTGEVGRNVSELARLRQQSAALEASKRSQQALIGQYLRGAWQTGREEYFKLLLNQENPALASRTLRYYRYFNDARRDKIDTYNATLAELAELESSIAATTSALEDQRRSLTRSQADLQARAGERQALLDTLDATLSGSSRRLEALEAERVEMELLVEELRRSIANLALGTSQQPFASLKGNLPWPVDGGLRNRWGTRIGLGDLNWQGVTIAAGAGDQVRAIHHGRVVYADWFSSSGLLLIIDHGDGYMSLYAHNRELYRDVGEWVNSGEVIAAVGNTGGQEDYGLYFEIRHNGDSENPSAWCVARN